ncbi:MAG: PhzF family isomerase, partial [Gemmatimonadota bacterium]
MEAALWILGALAVLVGLDRLLLRLEARGWINYRRRGLSRPGVAYHSLTLQSVFDPRAESLQQALYEEVEEREESGDPPAAPEGLSIEHGEATMRRYEVHQVDAFTTEPFTGNPAGVVPHADGLSEREMQAIARELNNSETAFVLRPDGPDHDVRVRFFTPTTEVPSCGHATIAAHYVRAVEGGLPSCTVVQKIGAGILPVAVERRGPDYRIEMTQGTVELGGPLSGRRRDEIVEALGLGPEELDPRCPVQVVSTGHSKVLVGLRSLERLHALEPDLAGLARISREIGCNGYFAFVLTPEDDVLAHGRMFAPAIGIPEDPVTGNANGPLGAYLVEHGLAAPEDGVLSFRARQGEAMGRPGVVEVTVE